MVDINQFAQTVVAGQPDLQFSGSVVTARVSTNQATALVAGQPVKIEDSVGGVPNVLATAANTDVPWGIVLRNVKDQSNSYASSNAVEIAREGTVVYMTAGAAIARGAPVEINYSTFKVITSAGVNPVMGEAYDKAAADGDLIRVWVHTQASNIDRSVMVADVTATLAQINAGLVLIPAAAGQQIRVTNYIARVTGTFATGTAVLLQSSNATPVVVSTIAETAIAGTAVVVSGGSNQTLGAGFGTLLGAGDGLVVANSGSAQTGGTSIQFIITYQQI